MALLEKARFILGNVFPSLSSSDAPLENKKAQPVRQEVHISLAELQDGLLESTHHEAIDKALGEEWDIICGKVLVDDAIRTVAIANPASPQSFFEGFGLTAEAALKMATNRMISNETGPFPPPNSILKKHSDLRISRTRFDRLLGTHGRIGIRKYSTDDPVVITIGEDLYRGDTFSEAYDQANIFQEELE